MVARAELSSRRSVSALWALAVLVAAVGAVLTAAGWNDLKRADQYAAPLVPLAGIVYATLGALIVRRVRNRIGWLLLGEGLGLGLLCSTSMYAVIALVGHPATLPVAKIVGALSEVVFIPAVIGILYMLLIFPTGEVPSPRWRPVAIAMMVVGAVAVIGFLVSTRRVALPAPGGVSLTFPNPFALSSVGPTLSTFLMGTVTSFSVASVAVFAAAAAGLVARYRAGTLDLRRQIKLLASAAVIMVVFQAALAWAEVTYGLSSALTTVVGFCTAAVPLLLIPIAITVAILKHRLYEIDVVINKAVVFGALAAFITAVYIAIVVGIGALVGSGNKPNLVLSIVATAIVAVAFQPVRGRVQRFANRLVYGNRATPYEVLSEFSDRVAATYASEEVLPRMARAIRDGTGARRAEVWLRSDNQLRSAAASPEAALMPSRPLALSDGRLPRLEGVDRAIEIRHQGELLGALTVTKPPGERLTPAEEKLLSDLASQAGLVLRNVGLTAELLARLEELRASRQRLVTAQDQERRRLERNLHDGAQQQLVALRTRLALVKRLAERDADKAIEMLSQLEGEAGEALETLRDLARGIYPPLLADQGLKAALEAQARKAPVPVEVVAGDIDRYPQEVEAAVYFCCLEALQNVAKYAPGARVTVMLQQRDSELSFSVADDGPGFDPATTPKGSGTQNMSDRLEALGGSLHLESAPGRGTTVTGTLALAIGQPVDAM